MKKIWGLALLFVLSLGLRLHRLNQVPAILNRDEAALAYNAYLLAETGQDEWGRNWPLNFESFGDYKLPGYIYTLTALFQVLPPTDYVVRLPSAVAGASLVVLAFFFAQAIKLRDPWAWLFAVLIALTPVFLFYSRMAFEANLALSLLVAGLVLLLQSHAGQKRMWIDILAVVLILASVLTYNAPLIILPLILPILIWIRGVKLWRRWMVPVIALTIVATSAGYQLFQVSAQKSGITIFQDETVWIQSVNYRQQFQGWWQTVLGNKYVYYAYLINQNFMNSFNSEFLVNGRGGHPWHSLPGQGHLLAVTYFFSMVGVVAVAVNLFLAIRANKYTVSIRTQASLLYLLLIALIPAVITVDAPHATRSLLFFFMLTIFTLYGLKTSYYLIRDHTQIKKNALFVAFSILLIVSSYEYGRDYFSWSLTQQQVLRPGFNQAIAQVEQVYPDQPIAVVDPEGYQYVLLAWYLKMSPAEFFETVKRQLSDRIGFKYGERVGRYHFIAVVDDHSSDEQVVIKWRQDHRNWEVLTY